MLENLTDIADILDDLPELLANEMKRRNLNVRQTAEEIGSISHSAVQYWTHRQRTMHIDNAALVLRWLHESYKEQ